MIRRTPRLAAAMVLTVLLAAASVRVHAHAVLVESTPLDGAVLESAPDRITLRFNEPTRVISLRLIDEGGQVTPLAQGPQSTPDQVAAPLPPLSPGSYVVSWRLLSVDGHPVGGSVLFTLGTAQHHVHPSGMLRAAEMPAGLRTAHLVARGLTYVGALLAAGLALFLVLFGRHAAVDHRAIARPGSRLRCSVPLRPLSPRPSNQRCWRAGSRTRWIQRRSREFSERVSVSPPWCA